jgi:nitrilase
MSDSGSIKVALAQIAPVWLDREATLSKVIERSGEASSRGASLVAFGEALVPGYPVWIERMDGARFEARDMKQMHAKYLEEAVCIEEGDLDDVCAAADDEGIAIVLGVIERPVDRGGHSVYCSRVYIEPDGSIGSVHRKMMPTYEERLAWAIGDGAGLVTHRLGAFTIGALNCWENWMPLARTALYAAGENVHIAIWPGGEHNTRDITRFIAMESRSFVLSVSGLLRASDIPEATPHRDRIAAQADEIICNGGTCAAGPDGAWLVEPVKNREELIVVELELARVREARQTFDASGHYARPDVLRLTVDRRRQTAAEWIDGDSDRA